MRTHIIYSTRVGCLNYLQHVAFNTIHVLENFWKYPQL